MLAGVFICTYSAIFISTPVLIYLGLRSSAPEVTKAHRGQVAPAE
jgi:preprotein translocase subunit SecF